MKTVIAIIAIPFALVGFMMTDAGAQRRGGGGARGSAARQGNVQGSGVAQQGGTRPAGGGGRGGFVPVDQRGPAYWEAQRRGTPAHWDLVYGTQPTYGNQGYYGSEWDQRNQGNSGAPSREPDRNDRNETADTHSALSSGSMVTDSGMGHVNAARDSTPAVKRRRPLRKWTPGVYRSKGRSVRRDFRDYDAFTVPWYKHHDAWLPDGWTVRTAWTWATWDHMVAWYDIQGEPYLYNYGDNVYYDAGEVYADGELAGTEDEYYEQASAQAASGDGADADGEWNSFGVYGVVQGDQRTADKIIQLAGNKDGAIRGTYYDLVADETHDIAGAIDARTQRVTWTIGKAKTTVCETGLDNLTRDEGPVLVMRGADKPQNWLMIRLGPDEE